MQKDKRVHAKRATANEKKATADATRAMNDEKKQKIMLKEGSRGK